MCVYHCCGRTTPRIYWKGKGEYEYKLEEVFLNKHVYFYRIGLSGGSAVCVKQTTELEWIYSTDVYTAWHLRTGSGDGLKGWHDIDPRYYSMDLILNQVQVYVRCKQVATHPAAS